MPINIESEAWCRKAYLNYHCYGNTMNISPDEMGQITQRWESRLKSWQATVSNDENQYEFDDSDFDKYKENGKKHAQSKTGYDGGGKGKMIARGSSDATMSIITTSASFATKKVVMIGAKAVAQTKAAMAKASYFAKYAKLGEEAPSGMDEVGQQAYNNSMESSKNNAEKIGFIVGSAMNLATGTLYAAKKPNKEQKEACDEMQNVFGNSQAALADTQADMDDMSGKLIELSDEANETNEEAGDDIEEEKTRYDMYKASYDELKAKVDAGEQLTEDEKALWEQLVIYMKSTGEEISNLQQDATDKVNDIYDDMSTYQEGYDYAAETMGEVEGQIQYAKSFDSTARTMCYVEACSQTLNSLSAAKNMYDAGKFAMSGGWATAWAWACVAAAGAGGALSAIGAKEQTDWAGKIGDEISLRKDTTTLNTETMDMYTEEIDAYDGFMSGVGDLTIDIPDDIDAPQDTAVPQSPSNNPFEQPEGTPDSIKLKKADE